MSDETNDLGELDEVDSGASLVEEQKRLHERIALITKDIVAIFREDLPTFVEKEVKRRFLEAVDFSTNLPSSKIAELRTKTRALGAQQVAVVEAALSSLEPWLSVQGIESARQSLTDNPAVWEPIRSVETGTEALLEEFGFPKAMGGYGVHYEPPARFIGGKFLKTLVEHYWRSLEELEKLQKQAAQKDSARVRADLLRKWDTTG